MIKEREIEDLYFNYQPIMKVVSPEEYSLYSYEVLLRSKKNHQFPAELFNRLIETEEGNRLLLEKCRVLLSEFMKKNQETKICFNLHPQQLHYFSTWAFLEEMSSFKNRLIIEITELPPENSSAFLSENAMLASFIKKIKGCGFRVALDDVSCGQHTLSTVYENLDSVTCLKFSLLPFRDMEQATMLSFLKAWQLLAKKNCLQFVVEGVENEKIASLLCANQVCLQQGYHWGKGQCL